MTIEIDICPRCGRELDVERLGLHDGMSCRQIGAKLPEEVHRLRIENAELRKQLHGSSVKDKA